MRNDWDRRYKELMQEVLRGTGEVLVGLETATPAQRLDVVYRPDATHRAERLPRGLLGRLTHGRECNIETYRNTPSLVRGVTTCGGLGDITTIAPSGVARSRHRGA